MFRKMLLYGLPLYMYGLELFLKSVANVSQDSVAGPTLAGAGIGFLLPLTELKPVASLPQEIQNALRQNGGSAYSARDKTLVDFIWVAFFLALVAWMYSVKRTFGSTGATPASGATINVSLTIGCAVFVCSIILTEIKERI